MDGVAEGGVWGGLARAREGKREEEEEEEEWKSEKLEEKRRIWLYITNLIACVVSPLPTKREGGDRDTYWSNIWLLPTRMGANDGVRLFFFFHSRDELKAIDLFFHLLNSDCESELNVEPGL